VPGSENAGYVLVDQVRYDDGAPWPLHADGFGGSLNRAAVDAFGNVASSWSALAPTPGIVRYAQPGDLNFDGDTDVDDIHRFALVLADPLAYRTAYGVPATMVGDVDGDGDVDFDDIDDFVVLLVGGVPAAAPQAATGPGVVVPPRVLAALPDAEVIDAPTTTAPRTVLARRSVPALSARQQEHRRIGSRRGERVGKRLEEKLSGALGTAKDQLSSLADS